MSERVVCPVCGGFREVDPDQARVDDQWHAHGDLTTAQDPDVHDRAEAVSRSDEQSARSSSEVAAGRDRAAELRDRGAEGRDLQARMREVLHDDTEGAENVLLRAGRDRARAADDRAQAAADRARAAGEREQAAHDRATALRAQSDARHHLLLAASDDLTGALTRHFGLAGVSHEIDRAARSGGKLAVAAIDVDHLDEVKQTLGRPGVDHVLRFVGDSLKANMRSYDLIVRYQEAEFLCAMPDITRAVATKRLATVAAVLTAADKQHAITFGVAEYGSADRLQDLVSRADEDLRAARSAGGRG